MHRLVLLIVCFINPMSVRYSTIWDRKGSARKFRCTTAAREWNFLFFSLKKMLLLIVFFFIKEMVSQVKVWSLKCLKCKVSWYHSYSFLYIDFWIPESVCWFEKYLNIYCWCLSIETTQQYLTNQLFTIRNPFNT